MSFRSSEQSSSQIHLPADVDWHMLDKSKFFIFGAALFSGVSGTLYPVMVLKTRQQVGSTPSSSSFKLCGSILRQEGVAGLYRGFPTSLLGTIPARVLYMSTLEITKSTVGDTALRFGLSESTAAAISNAVGGLTASVAAQLVWTPVDVISQRLMVQGELASPGENRYGGNPCHGYGGNPNPSPKSHIFGGSSKSTSDARCGNPSSNPGSYRGGSPTLNANTVNYKGGLDAFRSIIRTDGWRGLYRGFGMSILTYAPSNALWWASYCLAQRTVWSNLGYCRNLAGDSAPSSCLVVGVQGASAACAGGVTALLTTPLDTIKTRLQVLAGVGNKEPTVRETVTSLIKEGGWKACYRGIGPRWAMMVMSATTMITTYEFLKRLSKKKET